MQRAQFRESVSTYLVRCTERFLEAIGEAQALALAGDVGGELVRKLHYANALLDIIEDGLDAPAGQPPALDPLARVRDLLRAVRGDPAAAPTLH